MAELYKAAIGPRGQDYYLRHFAKFDADGKTGATWHWPAYWSTLNWLIYRKMWGWALVYGAALLGLALVVFGVGKLVFNYSDSTGLLLFLLFLTAAFVLPGLYANAWYYTYCSEKISAALRNTPEEQDARDVLAGQASTNKRWFGLAAANVAVLALGASGAALVLNLGQEGVYLAQMKKGRLAAGGLTATLQPVRASAGVAAWIEPSPAVPPVLQPAAPLAPVIAEPVRPPSPAPVQVAVANTDKPVSAAKPDQPVAAAPGAGPHARPVRPGPDVKAKTANVRRPWFVQIGAYAKEANAQNVRTRMEATGLPSASESSDTPAGRLFRVRAGPFESRSEAEKAVLRIKALDLPAILVRQ